MGSRASVPELINPVLRLAQPLPSGRRHIAPEVSDHAFGSCGAKSLKNLGLNGGSRVPELSSASLPIDFSDNCDPRGARPSNVTSCADAGHLLTRLDAKLWQRLCNFSIHVPPP